MPQPVTADLSGQTCLVTGANSGIGKEVARGLARLGARVVMACRNPARGEEARREIASSTGRDDVELMVVDLSSRAATADFARAFAAAHPRLDVLVNNAGIWASRREESAEGVELTWATNMLGYFQVADQLGEVLRAAPRARVVNVASLMARDLELDDVEFRRRPYNGVTAYAQSKQANRMFTWALARRLQGTSITANAMHPGGVNTALFAKAGGLLSYAGSAYAKMFGRAPAEGADTIVWLAASPEVEGETGKLWIDRREATCRFRDPATEDRLWDLCASMTSARAPARPA